VTITTSRDPAVPGETTLAKAGFDRASWRESAACRDADTELFFPIGSTGPAVAEISRAKAICAGCPVRQACLTYALATNQAYGIWGGYDENERRAMRRRQQRRAAQAARVGGKSG
jgi:WhiB family transcriptional regulator, redox-sensing transcriptional regulator